jgi:peptide/nickel transport system substrate-binding protein
VQFRHREVSSLRRERIGLVVIALLAAAAVLYWLQASRDGSPGPVSAGVVRGGRLIATHRGEPQSFNRYASANPAEELFARLTQATLVRLNRATGELEPRLAREWTASPDGLTWTVKLREGVRFSDGLPFTSSDVLFTFQVLYDKRVASPLAGSALVGDSPLTVRALDPQTVVIVFPAVYGPGLAILDSLPILPEHKLRKAFESGTFKQAWSVTTPPSEFAGLGPFTLLEYLPGQRVVYQSNPEFWRTDDQGRKLPYLEQIEVQIVPEQSAEMLRLEAGSVDVTTDQVRAEDLAGLQALQAKGVVTLNEAGVATSPEMFWLNLNPASALAKTRPWSQRLELRQAISHAVDRRRIVDTVYLGAAEPIFSTVTPGYGEWHVPDLPQIEFDQTRARALLASIGLSDRNGDGRLDDERGETARFALVTQKGHTIRERTCAIIQEQLQAVGLTVDVVALERTAFLSQVIGGNYEAAFFALEFDSLDPAAQFDFWASSKGFHIWHPSQAKPATEWEARIDDLMVKQSTTLDRAERRRLFTEAQRVLAANQPVITFAAPKVVVATSARVGGAMPSVLAPPILWNAEMLWLVPAPAGASKK